MISSMPSQYNSQEVEGRIYKEWEEKGYFKPEAHPSLEDNPEHRSKVKGKTGHSKISNLKSKIFSIIMPPPNANGSLHLGHAVFVTLEDIMIRYHRMLGDRTLWLPGADHAGFETQVVYQKKLEKEGRNWFTIPRDQLYKEISDFTLANKSTMENQLRRLGASCDWSREIFTLDERIIKIILRTFKKLFDDGLVYRGERIINWCVKHQTTLSDLEVKHEEQDGTLTHIKYPIKDSDKCIIVATTRPETMLGDTAVAVNPKDKRYKKLVGQTVVLPLVGREILIVADTGVDMKFGTGAVKVTPSHDPLDFEIAERHNLGKIQVIGQDGKMTDKSPERYRGLKAEEARARVVEDLKVLGLIEREESHKHAVGVCYKCNRVIEPLVMPQWFVKMKPLVGPVRQAVKKGEVKFVTKKFEKILFHWLKNIRDWNISRQIVWGIRIPVWYCAKGCSPIVTAGEMPAKCSSCDGTELKQETDVFDTWFSSGQWPFAVLQATGDFEKFYPTSVMETGWDILPFWVMRMLALGIHITGQAPFKHVYLHGLVRDKDRQKMSKSKGNVIDPLGVIDLYGADALRLALVFGVSAGNDIVISEDKIKAHRNFANKIWNASRFVMMNLDGLPVKPKLAPGDKKVLDELQGVVKEITGYLEKFDFNHAGETAYHYFWHSFCDKIIEEQKARLQNEKEKPVAQYLLYTILTTCLKFLHPFMPFVTEAVWQELPKEKDSMLIIEKWPNAG